MRPSKELLQRVFSHKLKREVKYGEDDNIQLTNNILHFSTITYMDSINVYEFIHDLKVWAFSIGYEISIIPSNIESIDKEVLPSGKILYWSGYINSSYKIIVSNEEGCVIACGEYVLKKMKVLNGK